MDGLLLVAEEIRKAIHDELDGEMVISESVISEFIEENKGLLNSFLKAQLAKAEPLILQAERERVIKELERHISVNSVGQLVIAIGEDTHLATKDYKWWQVLKAAG